LSSTIKSFLQFIIGNQIRLDWIRGPIFSIVFLNIELFQIKIFYEDNLLEVTLLLFNFGFKLDWKMGFTGNIMSDKEFQERKKEWQELQEKKERYKKQLQEKYNGWNSKIIKSKTNRTRKRK